MQTNNQMLDVTFKIFIHVTSFSSDIQANDLLKSITNTHDEEQDKADLLVPSTKSSKDDKTIRFPAGDGNCTKTVFVGPACDLSHNRWRILWFLVLFAVCFGFTWWFYKFDIVAGSRRFSLLTRIYFVILPLFASAFVAIASLWLLTSGYVVHAGTADTRSDQDPCIIAAAGREETLDSSFPLSTFGSIGDISSTTTLSADEGEIATTSSNHPNRKIRKSVRVLAGRPASFDEVLAPLSATQHPGAILCGPEQLRASITKAIHQRQPSCSIYDEQSDM